MKTPSKCPKCSAEMEEGFILEHRQPVRWIAGKAETSISGDVKSSGQQRRIESYRCIGCGYLESYARTTVR